MLRLDAPRSVSFCDGMTRRDFLHAGSLSLLGLTLPSFAAQKALAAEKAKDDDVNCIMLFLVGGPSHIDTFDPKPKAPAEIRGEFATIATNVSGIQVTAPLPRLAKIADKYALVRSVHHNKSNHNSGAYYSLVGREPLVDIVTANASATDFPHPGSVVSYLDPGTGKVPPFVS